MCWIQTRNNRSHINTCLLYVLEGLSHLKPTDTRLRGRVGLPDVISSAGQEGRALLCEGKRAAVELFQHLFVCELFVFL